jgi:hypothetical protein
MTDIRQQVAELEELMEREFPGAKAIAHRLRNPVPRRKTSEELITDLLEARAAAEGR